MVLKLATIPVKAISLVLRKRSDGGDEEVVQHEWCEAHRCCRTVGTMLLSGRCNALFLANWLISKTREMLENLLVSLVNKRMLVAQSQSS